MCNWTFVKIAPFLAVGLSHQFEHVENKRAGFRAASRIIPGAKRRGEPQPVVSLSNRPLEPVLGRSLLSILCIGL